MPNTHSTLTGLFTDIADAIREKDGTSTRKVADAFPAAIRAIPSGGDASAEDGIIDKTISGAYTNARVSKIGSSTFYECKALTTASFPACTWIQSYAFYYCASLTTVLFPVCTTIGQMAFYSCIRLTTASFPTCTSIGSSAFHFCQALTTASFPACTNIGSAVFDGCYSLLTVSLPVCTRIGKNAFHSCHSLLAVSFPACTNISTNTFYDCSVLTTVSYPACSRIESYAFNLCHNLLSLYLYTSSVCTLLSSDAFISTPIAGYTASTGGVYGSIFVPMSLLSAYKSATNWTYFADRFVGVEPEDM